MEGCPVLLCLCLLLTYPTIFPRKSGWSGSGFIRRSGSCRPDSAWLAGRSGVWKQRVCYSLVPCETCLPRGWGASCEEPPAAFWTFHGRLCRCGQGSLGRVWQDTSGHQHGRWEGMSGQLGVVGTILQSGMEEKRQTLIFVPR